MRRFIVTNFLFGDESREFADDDSLLEIGIVDSTGVLELLSFLEETFGIHVADEELIPENLDSVTSVASLIVRKLNGTAPSLPSTG